MVVLGIRPHPFQCPFFPLHFLLIILSFDVMHSELLTAALSETRKNIHQYPFPISWCCNVWWRTVTSPGFVDPVPCPCPTKQSPERPCRTSNFLCLLMCCYWCSCCGREPSDMLSTSVRRHQSFNLRYHNISVCSPHWKVLAFFLFSWDVIRISRH